jgi:predicted lipoprotein with Yx(FWY)xxD motif
MHRTRLSFALIAAMIAALVSIIVATSVGTAKTTHFGVASATSIAGKQTRLGKTLVDAKGRALYLFEGDKRDRSTLSAAGRAIWPPLLSGTKPAARSGVSASRITVIKGAAGRSQIAYNGHPLYYYVGDTGSGQTNGEGLNQFGALWYVLSPAGTAITSGPTARASGPSTGRRSGRGYPY